MWRLTALRRRVAGDRGAMALLIAIMVPVVLLGMGAFVVDAGSWYAERAQTQNGADAGAIAVADSCALGSCDTTAASSYAPANSSHNLDTSAVVQTGYPCGRSSRGDLPSCPAGAENGITCPKAPATGNYVDVRVSTDKAMTPIFGSVLGGTSKTIGACAQAVWKPPQGLGRAVPLTISACEWSKNTGSGTTFATIPQGGYAAGAPYYTSPPSYLATINTRRSDPTYDQTAGDNTTNFYVKNNIKDPHTVPMNAPVGESETVLTTHGFGSTCPGGTPGTDAPGQFGWLTKDSCTVSISGATYTGSTGNTPPPCGAVFQQSLQTKTPIYLPVYSSVTLSGSNAQYTLEGYAAFVVTGWNMGGSQFGVASRVDSVIAQADPTLPSGAANYCGTYTGSPSDVCIYGYFTNALVPPSAVTGSDTGGQPADLGVHVAYLAG